LSRPGRGYKIRLPFSAGGPLRLRGRGQDVRMRWIAPAALLAASLAAGCLVGPNYSTPQSDVAPADLPSPVAAPKPLNAADGYWWRSLNDPVLDGLVEAAFQNNLTLQLAGVRVLQARAQLSQAIGNLFPQQQGASGSINWTQTNRPNTF